MPVFRKGAAPAFREKRLDSAAKQGRELRGGRVVRSRKQFFEGKYVTGSPFALVNAYFHGRLLKELNQLTGVFPKRQINVLDWGCGKGVAAKELAQNPRLNVLGFSKDGYKEWLKPGNAEFIQTDYRVLPKYLKKRRVVFDVIYSHLGLGHLPEEELVTHLIALKDSLRIGGKIFFATAGYLEYQLAAKGLFEEKDELGDFCLVRKW